MSLPEIDPCASPLSSDELASAVPEKIEKFRQVTRSMADPPIRDQEYGCLSVIIFDEPKKTSRNKKVLGYLKLRGNWPDEKVATAEAKKVIGNVDSKHTIMIAPIGKWLAFTEDDRNIKECIEVCTEDRSELDKKAAEMIQQRNEEEVARFRREIREREEAVKKSDVYDDPESITFYTTKMRTFMVLYENRQRLLSQLHGIITSMEDTAEILRGLDERHSNYRDEWVDEYNRPRLEAGIPYNVPDESIFDEVHSGVRRVNFVDLEEGQKYLSRRGEQVLDSKGKGAVEDFDYIKQHQARLGQN